MPRNTVLPWRILALPKGARDFLFEGNDPLPIQSQSVDFRFWGKCGNKDSVQQGNIWLVDLGTSIRVIFYIFLPSDERMNGENLDVAKNI